MNRRALLGTSAIVLPALAGCAAIQSITGSSTPQAAVQAVFSEIQFVLPLVQALAVGISIAVPSSASVMASAISAISAAGPIFQSFDLTMTATAALPLVQQIKAYVDTAVNAVAGVVASSSALASYHTLVLQAETVVGLLATFVDSVSANGKAAARLSFPVVDVPLLHK